MRIDKYLKVSRLVKRREVAKTLCDKGLVLINSKVAKPANEVKVGDILTISSLNGKTISVTILKIVPHCPADQVGELFSLIGNE